jgi:hypothetical protein
LRKTRCSFIYEGRPAAPVSVVRMANEYTQTSTLSEKHIPVSQLSTHGTDFLGYKWIFVFWWWIIYRCGWRRSRLADVFAFKNLLYILIGAFILKLSSYRCFLKNMGGGGVTCIFMGRETTGKHISWHIGVGLIECRCLVILFLPCTDVIWSWLCLMKHI